MDLSTSETKLEKEQYASPHDFIIDIRHIFENARLYNTRDSEVRGSVCVCVCVCVCGDVRVRALSTADIQDG